MAEDAGSEIQLRARVLQAGKRHGRCVGEAGLFCGVDRTGGRRLQAECVKTFALTIARKRRRMYADDCAMAARIIANFSRNGRSARVKRNIERFPEDFGSPPDTRRDRAFNITICDLEPQPWSPSAMRPRESAASFHYSMQPACFHGKNPFTSRVRNSLRLPGFHRTFETRKYLDDHSSGTDTPRQRILFASLTGESE